MRSHSERTTYEIFGENRLEEPSDLFDSCRSASEKMLRLLVEPSPRFKFARLFSKAALLTGNDRTVMIDRLSKLGVRMNADPPANQSEINDSTIPAGYTYLGQFIAHEISFDKTLPTAAGPHPRGWRSPHIDLDSVYGKGPNHKACRQMYEADGASLKVSETTKNPSLNWKFPNDLLRGPDKHAIIGDERNDENLVVAQTHLALVKFHNNVVAKLRDVFPRGQLFREARKQVVRHFHWIVLNDYLPRLVDAKTLQGVKKRRRHFTVHKPKDLFMPLEFSAAAFRTGHSMVRPSYEWNRYHGSPPDFTGKATIGELFQQTKFSSPMLEQDTILSEWITDWRRFYKFDGFDYDPLPPLNLARRIDTSFDLHLDQMSGYPHHGLTGDCRAITVRNLLRGFALRLPSGEDVARALKITPLTPTEVASARYKDLLDTPPLKRNTPLWFYILREAELETERNGTSHLGPVGGRIVAETLVGLIENSANSITRVPDWRPVYSRRKTESNAVIFEMADLIDFAKVVDPIGCHLRRHGGCSGSEAPGHTGAASSVAAN